jgi:hypothetical protein
MAKVVSLGIHIVDILGRPVSGVPEGQNVALLDEIRVTVAGTAAGTAIDLAKLGAEVVAMGAIGEDELGNFLVDTPGSRPRRPCCRSAPTGSARPCTSSGPTPS